MDIKDYRIVYLGTPEISASLLEAMIQKGFNIVGVITQPDAPKKRGSKASPSPVGEVALKHNLPLHRPLKLNKDYSILDEWKPDLLLTYAYGQILSTKVLSYSKLVPLNVHASLLPKLRGASPIQTCLIEGDKKTGVCLMEMVKAMDAGRVFASEVIEITEDMNFTSLEEKVSDVAINLVLNKLPLFFEGKLEGIPQDESQATFCHYITKDDTELDLDYSIDKFINIVRAFSIKPGAFIRTMNGDEPLKILSCFPYDDKSVKKGELKAVDKKHLVLGLNNGQVLITSIQKPGKKPCDGSSFINGMGSEHVILIKHKTEDIKND